MGARENLQKLADRKIQEIKDLEGEIERARVYLQAIQDSIKALPREPQNTDGNDSVTLRPGTMLAKARAAILEARKPLHVNELLVQLGKASDQKAKVSLSGSISWYVRRNQIFTRPAANTFGLRELAVKNEASKGSDLPDDFGN
ncbi:MAG TPA: hypothetical protein VH437_24785 [Terriglobales bacterium]|jgi:hypothetical protein